MKIKWRLGFAELAQFEFHAVILARLFLWDPYKQCNVCGYIMYVLSPFRTSVNIIVTITVCQIFCFVFYQTVFFPISSRMLEKRQEIKFRHLTATDL